MNHRTAGLLALVIAAALFVWFAGRLALSRSQPPAPVAVAVAPAKADETGPATRGAEPAIPDTEASAAALRLARLRERFDAPGMRPNEAVFAFADAASYRRFLAQAGGSGLPVLARLDALHAVRVRYHSLEDLARRLADLDPATTDASGNSLMLLPAPPGVEARAARTEVPLGNHLREFLEIAADPGAWGRGVTIAIVDSGVAQDATFGAGRLRTLDLGLGTSGDGHGTAVAALAAGAAADAPGVAPAADVLGIRVTDANGLSDTFTVAAAIVAAVDAGAQVINVSLGGRQTSTTLGRAIDYALARGSVLVASAGNDQAAQLTWPAADPRVVSVGAVDATGQQVTFSNSGPQLQIAAPGYGVQTAWTDGDRVLFDGTSASAPIVAGAIAAMMSENGGMTAAQAWALLQQYASEGGPEGPDPDYGRGILNLGWAMARNDYARIDTAIASHHYDAATGTMEILVQNRSAQGVGGLGIEIDAGGAASQSAVGWLGAGDTQVVAVAVDQAQLARDGAIVFRTRLLNGAGVTDAVPENNEKVSALTALPGD